MVPPPIDSPRPPDPDPAGAPRTRDTQDLVVEIGKANKKTAWWAAITTGLIGNMLGAIAVLAGLAGILGVGTWYTDKTSAASTLGGAAGARAELDRALPPVVAQAELAVRLGNENRAALQQHQAEDAAERAAEAQYHADTNAALRYQLEDFRAYREEQRTGRENPRFSRPLPPPSRP